MRYQKNELTPIFLTPIFRGLCDMLAGPIIGK
jgi:hypothetical protein